MNSVWMTMPLDSAWYCWIATMSSIALLMLNFYTFFTNFPAFSWANPRISSTFRRSKLDEEDIIETLFEISL